MHGVGAAQIDVAARVTADEVVQNHLTGHEALLDAAHRRQLHLHVVASGAADAQRVLVLVVHVDEGLGLQNARLQVAGTVETRLLIARHQHFQRSVLDGLVGQNGEAASNTDSVVRAQRGAGGLQVLAVNARNDGVLGEVNVDAVVGLADHIHVALQTDRGLVFATYAHDDTSRNTGEGSLANDQVVALVHIGLAAELLSLGLQEGQDLLVAEVLSLLVGSTGNLSDLQEILPDALRLGELLVQLFKIPMDESFTRPLSTWRKTF